MISPADYLKIRRSMLSWYRRHKRDLPWRRTKDPYAIWVSEIMLQQTRVEAVIPYYGRFLRRFPDIASLARAAEEEVLAAWSGLGYYRRARHLHAAAKELLARHGGTMPQSQAEILALPGIGRYTAGAIASIAFGNRSPILDGNAIRLLTRLFAIPGGPSSKETQRKLWKLAEDLLPSRDCGEFNQALMEIPAMLCTPQSPRCELCPLESFCEARARGEETRFPEKKSKPAARSVRLAFACLCNNGRFLLRRRTASPLEGMWEFPLFGSDLGGRVSRWLPLGEVKHSIMDQRITARYFLGETKRKATKEDRWFSFGEIESGPVTTLTKKGLRLAESRGRDSRDRKTLRPSFPV